MRTNPFLLVTTLGFSSIGCGGSGNSNSLTIAISPTAAAVQTGGSQQFTATISGKNSLAVVWEVNGLAKLPRA